MTRWTVVLQYVTIKMKIIRLKGITMKKWDAPLPKHTKLDYYECYAKIILSHLLSINCESILIRDRPDLQFIDDSRGIEVTQAIDQDQQIAENLYTNIHSVRSKEGAIQEIHHCGCKYEDGILIGKLGTDSFKFIMKAIETKLEKLNNGGYARFCHYELFVFSDIYANDMMLNDTLLSMRTLSNKYKLSFEKIFVSVPGSLYIFELPSKQFHVIDYSNKLQYEMACQARELVEADM